jgi:hypothetical protein
MKTWETVSTNKHIFAKNHDIIIVPIYPAIKFQPTYNLIDKKQDKPGCAQIYTTYKRVNIFFLMPTPLIVPRLISAIGSSHFD